MAVGRISGPLLKDNLLRNGVNLAFETNLLYLDVVNRRIGVNTATPTNDLSVNGTTRSTNIQATNSATLASFTFSGNTLSSSSSTINLLPSGSNPVVYQGTISVGSMNISGNTIAGVGTNTNLEITTSGTGAVNFNSSVTIYGNLHATGNITADGGSITLGDANTDNVVFGGEVNSHILPNITDTYNLGSPSARWNTVYSDSLVTSTVTTASLSVPTFRTSALDITGNTISSYTANTNIQFTTLGTGGVVLGNLKFRNNSITNVSPNAVTTFEPTGSGYVKMAGTFGVVIPSGTSDNRPPTQYQEIGMIRFNTQLGLVEVYNGISWGSVAGSGSGVTQSTAQDIGVQTAIAIG